jgi:hypothetical protein
LRHVRRIGNALDPNGKVSFYGCNSGRDRSFLQWAANALRRRVEGQTGTLQCFPWGGCRRAGVIAGANPSGGQ